MSNVGIKVRIAAAPLRKLPDSLPEYAFAHIKPDHWLVVGSVPARENLNEGSVVRVPAKIVDVTWEVLPGREREFCSFVRKVSRHHSYSFSCLR